MQRAGGGRLWEQGSADSVGQCGREGRRRDQDSGSLVLVLKWPQARQGTDGLFLMLSRGSGEREKGKNKYHHSQEFKNKLKNLKDKQLTSEVPPASRAFQGKRELWAWGPTPSRGSEDSRRSFQPSPCPQSCSV